MFELTQPLDPAFIRAFDRITDALFEYSTVFVRRGVILPGDESLQAAGLALGKRLLGSEALTREIWVVLGEGPAHGDVLGALDVLYENGQVELSHPTLWRQVKGKLGKHELPLLEPRS